MNNKNIGSIEDSPVITIAAFIIIIAGVIFAKSIINPLTQMTELKDWPMKTMKLPDDLNNLEDLADFVTGEVKELDSYCLVGDSFGAAISLALATRNPQGLHQIKVPTLILTPEEDRLIGNEAAQIMLKGISNAVEQVLPGTGHMFRFTHPTLYSRH